MSITEREMETRNTDWIRRPYHAWAKLIITSEKNQRKTENKARKGYGR